MSEDDDGLYFGPCLPDAETARLINHGLPPEGRIEFTRAAGSDWLTDYIAKAMGNGPLSDYSFARTPPPGDPVNAFSRASLDARKLSSVVVVPHELLMDAGIIPDTRPKPPPPTWRTRLRWKRDAWRERAARGAYKIIAGDWPDGGEDDW